MIGVPADAPTAQSVPPPVATDIRGGFNICYNAKGQRCRADSKGRMYPVDEHGNRITKILANNDKPPDMDPFIWWKAMTPKTRAEWYRDHYAAVEAAKAEAPVPTPGPGGQPSGTSASSSSGVDRAPTPAPAGPSGSSSGAQVVDPCGVRSASAPPPVAPALC